MTGTDLITKSAKATGARRWLMAGFAAVALGAAVLPTAAHAQYYYAPGYYYYPPPAYAPYPYYPAYGYGYYGPSIGFGFRFGGGWHHH
jgi:hypothetical protein